MFSRGFSKTANLSPPKPPGTSNLGSVAKPPKLGVQPKMPGQSAAPKLALPPQTPAAPVPSGMPSRGPAVPQGAPVTTKDQYGRIR